MKTTTTRPTFHCDKCLRGFFDKVCFEDKECELTICEVCMADLPSYENEQELMRVFRMSRVYSTGNMKYT